MTRTETASKGKAIGTVDGKETLWAIDASGECWTNKLGCAPRHDEATAEAIRSMIRAQGYEPIEAE